jgi:hypothetical protein
MSNITKQTRRESYDKIINDLGKRQLEVYINLQQFDNGATAKELAVHMHQAGLVASPERNSVHPRLNELVAKGLIEIVGKKLCTFTNRKVAVYKVSV